MPSEICQKIVRALNTEIINFPTKFLWVLQLHSEKSIFFFFTIFPYIVEKLLLLGWIFKTDFLMDLHVLWSLESKNHIFRDWFVCVYACYQHNSIIIIIINTRNSKFGILCMHHMWMQLETCYESWKILCALGHT